MPAHAVKHQPNRALFYLISDEGKQLLSKTLIIGCWGHIISRNHGYLMGAISIAYPIVLGIPKINTASDYYVFHAIALVALVSAFALSLLIGRAYPSTYAISVPNLIGLDSYILTAHLYVLLRKFTGCP